MSPLEILTLENIEEKLPQWSPHDDSHVHAVIDMGSNGIRFSITSLAPPCTRALIPLYSARAAISLLDALIPSAIGPIIPNAVIEQVASALSRFHHIASRHEVPQQNITIIATEAMRRASNTTTMLKAIAKATSGLGVYILDPSTETLLGAVMGSRSGLVDIKGGALVLDLGGGSVQMTWVDTNDERYGINAALSGESLPYGAAKLTQILDGQPEEARILQTAEIANGFRDLYAKLCAKFPTLQAIKTQYEKGCDSPVKLYLCGGGFRGYGSMLMHEDPIVPYPIPSINTYTVHGDRFKDVNFLRRKNEEINGKIYGMSKRRRKQFESVAAVVKALVSAVPNVGQVTFCSGSNREGLLMMKLPREIRETNPVDALTNLSHDEQPIVEAIVRKMISALPKALEGSKIPTVLNTGIASLFVRQIWTGRGYDGDANSSLALHSAVSRDPNASGLTHIARAALGLTLFSRWGGSLSPADTQLFNGLKQLLNREHPEAFFWSRYLGAVASLLASLFPTFPTDSTRLETALSFDSQIVANEGKKEIVTVNINIADRYKAFIDQENSINDFNTAASKIGDAKAPKKILAQLNFSS